MMENFCCGIAGIHGCVVRGVVAATLLNEPKCDCAQMFCFLFAFQLDSVLFTKPCPLGTLVSP